MCISGKSKPRIDPVSCSASKAASALADAEDEGQGRCAGLAQQADLQARLNDASIER
jgi:hypothetical protein